MNSNVFGYISNYVKRSVAAVPALRFALGIAVVASIVVFAAGLLDLRVAFFGIITLLVLSVILIVVSRFAEDTGLITRIIVYAFVMFCITAVALSVVLFGITFFVRPDTLRDNFHLNSFYHLFGFEPSKAVLSRNADQYISEFEGAVSSAATPQMVADALERTTAFWRQPEQRQILKSYRCEDPPSNSIFLHASAYTFENPTLMKDVNTITHYYDAVARCVTETKECDAEKICSHFKNQMDDFQRLYTNYFREVRILELYDPIAKVRDFLRQCENVSFIPDKREKPEC